jgi:NAD(P)-dependent dehydrogenase (short-subunit alcohol dehydrogenase family)
MDLGHRQAAIRAARRGFLGGRRGIWPVPPTGPMTSTLNGSKALVTGATAGIGHAIALQLAREGAESQHGRNSQRGGETVKDIENAGGKARFIAADLSEADDVRRLATEAGAVDILVNNGLLRRSLVVLCP